jgi:cyclic-di-GMP-binding protein
MPSFDIVNKIDAQTLDNALNNARKEIVNRYDFRDSKTSLEFDKKSKSLHIVTENEMKIKAIEDIIMQRMAKQGIDPKILDLGKEQYAAGNMIKKLLRELKRILQEK